MSRLHTQILYGLRTDVSGNAFFSTDDEVLYLVGNAVALHNFAQHRQKLIRMPDKHKINMMTIAPNKWVEQLHICLLIFFPRQLFLREEPVGLDRPRNSNELNS